MMRSVFLNILLSAGSLMIALLEPAYAAKTTIGPFRDFQQTFSPTEVINGGFGSTQTNTFVYFSTTYPYAPTNLSCNPYNPSPPGLFCGRLYVPDLVEIGPGLDPWFPPNLDLRVAGASYLTYETGDLEFTFTTIYGRDASTAADPSLAIAGFEVGNVLIDFVSEKVIGKSGTVYPATTRQVLSLDQLRLLPGLDLSPFQGSGSSLVYLFETIVPFAEVTAVPESSSPLALGLLSLGFVTVSAVSRHYHRQH
ncbi:MAG: hypothetical protein IM550_21415 [Microcystis sp. M54BS1]|uniref:hypothetical protein n=1 Tax=unclassified Microcystis TaxID=2643300 RepID=UPI00257D9740|nr:MULTISPECIES: hypothetical protein [unclassified Microcystis]MCA2541678.1 hypothetical protein [Microcystis sp. M54BS1]MCA2595574.1 hypothetical protein [Microcystis sp. M38BS1]MCA2610826.1 hypothetical protein [Microcystis sp. M27BS1]MCA2504349.1 hypothetical protein [Microcystis sp. M62BS1]MCA2513253.1 hypothetical protein [Microcystis sp. M60BS1]